MLDEIFKGITPPSATSTVTAPLLSSHLKTLPKPYTLVNICYSSKKAKASFPERSLST